MIVALTLAFGVAGDEQDQLWLQFWLQLASGNVIPKGPRTCGPLRAGSWPG